MNFVCSRNPIVIQWITVVSCLKNPPNLLPFGNGRKRYQGDSDFLLNDFGSYRANLSFIPEKPRFRHFGKENECRIILLNYFYDDLKQQRS